MDHSEPKFLRPGGQRAFRTLSWLVVVLGLFVALLVPVAFRDAWVGEDPPLPESLTGLFQYGAPRLFGLALVAGSVAAFQSRRAAGLVILFATPVLAFALSYPAAGHLVVRDDTVYPELPPLSGAVLMAVLFDLPFAASWLAVRKRKPAAPVFLAAALPLAVSCGFAHWAAAFLPRLAAWTVLGSAFAAFWLTSQRLHWPSVQDLPRTRPGRLAVAAGKVLLIAFLVIGWTFASFAMGSSLWTPDCSGPSLFTRPLRPGHVAATVRILRSAHTHKVGGSWAGTWAVGIVEERFFGLKPWEHLALLTDGFFWEGRTFFVSGSRAFFLLARALPIVDATRCGSEYSVPLADAAPQLRVLHEAPADGSRRVVGSLLVANPSPWRPEPTGASAPKAAIQTHSWRNHESAELYDWAFLSPRSHRPLSGARIAVTCPAGTSVVTTDRNGVYEVPDLPPADCTLHLIDIPAHQVLPDVTIRKADTADQGMLPVNLVAEWTGAIEGTVKDAAGRPVSALVELRNPDGTNAERGLGGYVLTTTSGSFRFEHLPAGGRYLVLMNRFGPSVRSPYRTLYYPSAKRPGEAHVFEIPGSARIRNVDFVVHSLPEHRIPIRVVWPDGSPVQGSVAVVNVQPEAYDDLGGLADDFPTGPDGTAEVRVFGDGRVKVQASANDSGATFSGATLLEAAQLPRSMDLVVPFASQRPAMPK